MVSCVVLTTYRVCIPKNPLTPPQNGELGGREEGREGGREGGKEGGREEGRDAYMVSISKQMNNFQYPVKHVYKLPLPQFLETHCFQNVAWINIWDASFHSLQRC